MLLLEQVRTQGRAKSRLGKETRREHIKTLWEALGPGGFFIFKSVAEVKAADDDNSWFEIFDWARLEKILEMSATDFAAEIITITINDSENESE